MQLLKALIALNCSIFSAGTGFLQTAHFGFAQWPAEAFGRHCWHSLAGDRRDIGGEVEAAAVCGVCWPNCTELKLSAPSSGYIAICRP